MRTTPKHARPRTPIPRAGVLPGALVGLLLVIPLLMGAGITLYGLCTPQSTVRRLIFIGYAQLSCLMFLCCSVLVCLLQQWRAILHQSGGNHGAAGEETREEPLPSNGQPDEGWYQEQTAPRAQTGQPEREPDCAPACAPPRLVPDVPPEEYPQPTRLDPPTVTEHDRQTTVQPPRQSPEDLRPQEPESSSPLPSALERYEAAEEAAVLWKKTGQEASTRATAASAIRLEPRLNTSMLDTPAVLLPDAQGRYLLQGTGLEPDPAQLDRVYRAKKLRYGGHGDLFQLALPDGTLLDLAQDNGSYRLLSVRAPAQVVQQQDGSYRLTRKGILHCTKAE